VDDSDGQPDYSLHDRLQRKLQNYTLITDLQMAFFFEYLWIPRMEKSQMYGSDKGLKKRKPILFKQVKQ